MTEYLSELICLLQDALGNRLIGEYRVEMSPNRLTLRVFCPGSFEERACYLHDIHPLSISFYEGDLVIRAQKDVNHMVSELHRAIAAAKGEKGGE